MPEISSLQNPKIKYLVKLREDKRQRQRDSLTLVEGVYELELVLASGILPREVYHCPELAGGRTVCGLPARPVTVSRPVFEKISHREGPDGWLALVAPPERSLARLHPGPSPLLVLVESVEKPGNLGAILRSAECAGADAVLVTDPKVDLYSPGVVRASRGALFSLPALELTGAEALTWLRAQGIRILAATPQAQALYTELDLTGPVCLALGTEDRGLSDFWLQAADLPVRIPMRGQVNSLNVSASAAILLFEAVRQRSSHG